jgi:hypothetical protein
MVPYGPAAGAVITIETAAMAIMTTEIGISVRRNFAVSDRLSLTIK